MKSYNQAVVDGDVRLANALKMRPFSCIFGFAFLMSLVAASVYIVVFSDTKEEQCLHTWRSLVVVVTLAVTAGYFLRRERRKPLSLAVRRFALRAIVFAYAACVVYFISLAFLPYAPRGQIFATLLRLAVAIPVPAMCWHILQQYKKGDPVGTDNDRAAPGRV